LLKTVKQFFGQNPKESEDFGRIINKFHTERIVKYLKESEKQIILGGEYDI